MIRDDGWTGHNIWEHSSTVRELYTRRARDEEEEMTCAAQAVELLTPFILPGDSLLDVGCGTGYFFHSLRKRGLEVEYWGIDASPALIEIGKSILPSFGLPIERLQHLRIEDVDGLVDHVVCMNVLSNMDNYHKPLERLLKMSRKTMILRESLSEQASYSYVRDEFLDDGVDLGVYVNTYDTNDVIAFMKSYDFDVSCVEDRRSGGEPELVIGYPHHWTFLVAQKQGPQKERE